MPRPHDLPDLTLLRGDATLVVPSVAFTLYVDGAPDGEGILDFYRRSRDALGGALTHYLAESMKRRAALDARAETMVPAWVRSPREGKSYFMQMSGCGEAGGVTAASMELWIHWRPDPGAEARAGRRSNWRILHGRGTEPALPITRLRVSLPIEHPLAVDPEALVAWVAGFTLVQRGGFLSGTSAYAVERYDTAGSSEAQRLMDGRLASVCRRFPGLEWRLPGAVMRRLLRWDPRADDIVSCFPRASWLTLIDEGAVTRLGGRAAIEAAFAPEPAIRVLPAGGGALVRAGHAPEIGDLARFEILPLVRRVAAALRPARLPTIEWASERPEGWAGEWLEAFDVERAVS